MQDYGTIGHLLSEAYLKRVEELRAEGKTLDEAAIAAH